MPQTHHDAIHFCVRRDPSSSPCWINHDEFPCTPALVWLWSHLLVQGRAKLSEAGNHGIHFICI